MVMQGKPLYMRCLGDLHLKIHKFHPENNLSKELSCMNIKLYRLKRGLLKSLHHQRFTMFPVLKDSTIKCRLMKSLLFKTIQKQTRRKMRTNLILGHVQTINIPKSMTLRKISDIMVYIMNSRSSKYSTSLLKIIRTQQNFRQRMALITLLKPAHQVPLEIQPCNLKPN